MSGDLIIPQESYPIRGDLDKVINYSAQRDIFLSKKEGGQMSQPIDMNNNFIENLKTPTANDHAVDKYYVDTNFLEKKGGVITGPISMSRFDIIDLPDTPKLGDSAVNRNYVTKHLDTKLDKTFKADLDMGGYKIENVGTPLTYENDTAVNVMFFNRELNASNANLVKTITSQYKKYVDDSHVSPSNSQKDVFRYLMEDADQSDLVKAVFKSLVFANSPHTINKKAYKLTLTKDSDGSNEYRSRVGLNLYQLPLGLYTTIVEFFPPEMSNISVTASGQTIYIANQTTKIFSSYAKTLIKFHQNRKQAPDYIFIDLHGKTTKSDTTSYLIFYGIEGYHSSIDPTVYDNWYTINNENMEILTNLDLQNHKITNLANPTSNNDAVNKRYLDIFETKINNLLPPKNVYEEVFGTDFYDLVMDTARFSLVKSVSGVVIDKVEPNSYPFTDRFLTDYDPKYGIKIGVKSHILTATFNKLDDIHFFSS